MILHVDAHIGNCEQTVNISNHRVESVNQTEKSNIKLQV